MMWKELVFLFAFSAMTSNLVAMCSCLRPLLFFMCVDVVCFLNQPSDLSSFLSFLCGWMQMFLEAVSVGIVAGD